jgi:PAS domain S-box-containing protein
LAKPTTSETSPPWRAAFALTLLGYLLAGWAALRLAIPPGYASPLYPAAGVAVAGVLIGGWRVLPAVALGAFAVNLSLNAQRNNVDMAALLLPLVIGVGAALQAGVGAALVKRHARQPLTLSEPRDVAVFLLASIASCGLSSGLANTALWLIHTVQASQLPFSLATWWVGDLLGVLIATPVVLCFFGQPRDAWAPRRASVGLTLMLVTALLTVGIRQVAGWNRERVQAAFDRDANTALVLLTAQLREPLQALEALRGVYVASDDVTRTELALATQAWLVPGRLQAIGWSERVQREDVPAFEARVRAEGLPKYAVFDRADAPPPGDDEVVALRFIEPMAGNESALGVNVLSIPAARAAVAAARRSGQPAASEGFLLTQKLPGQRPVGVAVYQAIYTANVTDPAKREAAFRGVAFVTLRMDDQLTALTAQIAPYLTLCVVDGSSGTGRQRLAGPQGCETQSAELRHVQALNYAGRPWELSAYARNDDLAEAHSADVWMFALVGLLFTAMLGGFLLLTTGRTRRIETAVRERTAALQAEVHEREVAEAALRESEQRFRNILNNVPIGVIYTDLRGRVKQSNPRFCELTGYTPEELLLLSLADCTHPDDLDQDLELLGQLVRGEIPMYRRHERFITKPGTTVWVQATVSLLRDAQGKPRSIVGVVEDITEHLKLEAAEHAREAAEASNQAKSEFLSRMSHELRTPLNAMLGFAQLLELDPRQPLSPAQQPWVSQIQKAGWHLLEMINDVLDLSRIDSGNLRLQIETLNLSELLAATVVLVEADARQRRIVISQDLAPGSATLLGDTTRVKQILTNLLSNAVKYNNDGGRVHIASQALAGDRVEISVTDSGLGLSARQLTDLFQPFNRLGREHSAQQGTGIGLVISQRLAELMGGTLRAHSAAGQGSSFILNLPCSNDPDTVRSDLDALAPAQAGYHRRLVHYVEDNETNVEVMRGMLAQRPQVEMLVSMTGTEGLRSIRARHPDLILLDLHLPDISGMEVLRQLQADVHTAGIPVVVVSADALAQQIDAAFEAGCTHYLTKPVNVGELLTVLDDLLERLDTRFG